MSTQLNNEVITKFFESFKSRDSEGMVSCYSDGVTFEDPAFGELDAKRARNMWRMLILKGGEDFSMSFSNIVAHEGSASADWEAHYTYSATGRKVHNIVHSEFILEDGKIIKHVDHFDMWRWSRQAMGITGTLIGWSSMFKNKVQTSANKILTAFIEKYSKN